MVQCQHKLSAKIEWENSNSALVYVHKKVSTIKMATA